eukprot:15578277-Heterocapsa_arctica.AAC.1
MRTASMCIGHTKRKEHYTVQCSSASGIVCFGTADSWIARQPRVSPAIGNNEPLHYITIWYLPAGASSREGNQTEVIEEIAKTWYKPAGVTFRKDNHLMSLEEIAKARQEAACVKKGQAAKQEPVIPKAKAHAKAQATQPTGTSNKVQPPMIDGKLHPAHTTQGQGPRLPPPREPSSSSS